MKTIIATIACCLITAAATAQENYYKTDCEIRINQDTILTCYDWGKSIMLEYKASSSFYSLRPQHDENASSDCDYIALNNESFQDQEHLDSVMMAVFLNTFTDEQIRKFYMNEYKSRILFSFSFCYDDNGDVIRSYMTFDNTPGYTSVPPSVYVNFINAFQENYKLKVTNKKYPYYYSVYGFMVPNLSIIPKSTKK